MKCLYREVYTMECRSVFGYSGKGMLLFMGMKFLPWSDENQIFGWGVDINNLQYTKKNTEVHN